MLAENPVELITDFQQFYGVKVDKMIDKDPLRAQYLISGLLRNPRSLYRAEYLKSRPMKRTGTASRVMGWYEWSPITSLLVMIYNHMLVRDGGSKAMSTTLKSPSEVVVISSANASEVAQALGG